MSDDTVVKTPVAPDMFAKEQELYAEIESLATNMSTGSLEIGWKANELYSLMYEEFMEEAGGSPKKALTTFVNHLRDRLAETDARTTILDRIKVSRVITRDIYDKIVAGSDGKKPTYHQLRSCIFGDAGLLPGETKGTGPDHEDTDSMLDWAVQNKWPSVIELRDHRAVVRPKTQTDPKDAHWGKLVKQAQIVDAESDDGSDRKAAAKLVIETFLKESGLTIQ